MNQTTSENNTPAADEQTFWKKSANDLRNVIEFFEKWTEVNRKIVALIANPKERKQKCCRRGRAGGARA